MRRATWAKLTKSGIPLLFVLRPLAGGFTPPNFGDRMPVKDVSDKRERMLLRQLYQQKRIGTIDEVKVSLKKEQKSDLELELGEY